MTRPHTLRIANPIYDVAFKYLLDDNRIARLFLSTLIGEKIKTLTFRPTEYIEETGRRGLAVFRMDFCAQIQKANGEQKLVIIEIQKAKFASDIMRFRKYLGHQYASQANTYELEGRERAMPIFSIYFLGHGLAHSKEPVIRVCRQYSGVDGLRLKETAEEEFIESLTHDSLVVQIPYLNRRRQSELECLLGIFDQSQQDPIDGHHLSVREEDYPEKFRGVIRRLIMAISESRVREKMEVEDIYLVGFDAMERKLADQEMLIAKNATVIGEKEAVIGEKDAMIGEKDAMIGEKDAMIGEKDAVIERAVKCLVESGMSEEIARARIGAAG